MSNKATGFIYEQTKPGVFTVGHYDPSGKWHGESDWKTSIDAARCCHFLNGGGKNADNEDQRFIVGERDVLVLVYKRKLPREKMEFLNETLKKRSVRAVVVVDCDEVYVQRNPDVALAEEQTHL